MPSLGSQDFVEDAVDSLQKGELPYLLLTGTHTNYTRLDSSMDKQGRDNLLAMVRSGEFEELLLEHYRRNPIPE